MPEKLLPGLLGDLANGHYTQALSAVEGALAQDQAKDRSLLRDYRWMLLRKLGAVPRIGDEGPHDEDILPADPEAPWLDNEQAWALVHDGPVLALDRFRHLRRRAPLRLDVALGEVEALGSLLRFTKARLLLKELEEQHGWHVDWKLSAAQLDVDESHFQQALDRLNEVVRGAPHHERALHDQVMCFRAVGNRPEARRVLDQHDTCCRESILLHLSRGWLHFDGGNWDRALDEFGYVLALGHRHPKAVVGKVMVLRRRGESEEARSLLNQVDSALIDPQLANQSGWIAFESAQYKEAVAVFDRALDAHPLHA